MKKLTQTKLHKPEEGIRGHHAVTSYACYFDLEIEEVPNIEDLFDCQPSTFWYDCFSLWMKDYMQHNERVHSTDPYLDGHNDYYFAVGPSSRGCKHQVIYKGGELYWDPHPSREGLTSVDFYLTLEKI